MISNVKGLLRDFLKGNAELIKVQQELLAVSKETEWAHIYHDSIRGKAFLEQLPLNIGRWAGNYSFFYLLNRILGDYKPRRILDLGLGESSKFIATYLDHYLSESEHTIVEQSEEWVVAFNQKFRLSDRSTIVHCPLYTRTVNGFESNGYKGFNEKIEGAFDLYIVDGPFGSDRYSRYDIIDLLTKTAHSESQFVIMFDDSHRTGEADTIKDILSLLKSKQISFYTETYAGHKSTTVIATEAFRYCTSL